MSNLSNNNLRVSNEHLQLIDILNTMYNDNTRNINTIIETLNTLINNNNQIRNVIIQILGSNNFTNNNFTNNNLRRNISRRWETTNRFLSNNEPSYINEYYIPLNNRNRRNITSSNMLSQLIQNFLQPVEIFPTQDQIDIATRRVRYCDIVRPLNTSCPISMEEFHDNDNVLIIRQCGHIFHSENLLNWFRTNSRCPVCRFDIRNYNTNSSSQYFNNFQTNSESSNNIDTNQNTNQNNLQNLLNNFQFDITMNDDLSGNEILSSILLNTFNRY